MMQFVTCLVFLLHCYTFELLIALLHGCPASLPYPRWHSYTRLRCSMRLYVIVVMDASQKHDSRGAEVALFQHSMYSIAQQDGAVHLHSSVGSFLQSLLALADSTMTRSHYPAANTKRYDHVYLSITPLFRSCDLCQHRHCDHVNSMTNA